MTSAQNSHGGQEATILSLYTTMYHWGCIVVTPGYTDDAIFKGGGNPYGTSVSSTKTETWSKTYATPSCTRQNAQ